MTHPYGAEYRRRRKAVLGEPCIWCGAPATTGEHLPPLSAYPPGEWQGSIYPACAKCNFGNKARGLRSGTAPQPVQRFGSRRGLVP